MSYINKQNGQFSHPLDLTVSKLLKVARKLPSKALKLTSSAIFATGSVNVIKLAQGVHVSVARMRGLRGAEARSTVAKGLQIEGRLRGRSKSREVNGKQRSGQIHDGMFNVVGFGCETEWHVTLPAQAEFEAVNIEFPEDYFHQLKSTEPELAKDVLAFIEKEMLIRRPMTARQKMLFAQMLSLSEEQPGQKLLAESVALSALFEAFAKTKTTPDSQSIASASISYALEIIEERLEQPPSIRELAKLTRMSETGFKRTFSRNMGRPVGEYILGRRMELARELIGAGLPVARIAADVGYATSEAFSKAFQKHFGVSPRQFQDHSQQA